MDAVRTKSILAQFINATKSEDNNVQFAMDEDNINIWYIRIHNISGNEDEFVEGEYLFRIHIPEGAGKTWLSKPPRFIALTPNGIFEVDKQCCIHIGEYHAGAKVVSLGVAEFVFQLLSGMIGWRELTSGINLVNNSTSLKEKSNMAKNSTCFNRTHYPGVIDMIERVYADYSKSFVSPTEKIKNRERTADLMSKVKPATNPTGAMYDLNVNKKKERTVSEKPPMESTTSSSSTSTTDTANVKS